MSKSRAILKDNLKVLRARRGLSLAELADRAELDPGLVRLIENEDYDLDVDQLGQLSSALDIETLAAFLDPGTTQG